MRVLRTSPRTRVIATLSDSEQLLIVGRIEMEYSYEQLAIATGRPSANAVRMALGRALVKLSERLRGRSNQAVADEDAGS